MITKNKVIQHFGSVTEVAEFFGIEVQAVYQWGDEIPELREAQLLLRLPGVFGQKQSQRQSTKKHRATA